jgi:hypothetical protein
MKKEMNVEKYKKLTKVARIIIQIMFWSTVVLGCIAILFNIVSIFIPYSFFNISDDITRHLSLSNGGIFKFSFDLEPHAITNLKPLINVVSLLIMISAILLTPILHQLIRILKNVEKDLPFATENTESLYNIGKVLFIGAFALPGAELIAQNMIIDIIKIPNLSSSYSINLYLLMMSFLIFILAGIFKYGNFLQQEYDTTL